MLRQAEDRNGANRTTRTKGAMGVNCVSASQREMGLRRLTWQRAVTEGCSYFQRSRTGTGKRYFISWASWPWITCGTSHWLYPVRNQPISKPRKCFYSTGQSRQRAERMDERLQGEQSNYPFPPELSLGCLTGWMFLSCLWHVVCYW